MTTSKDKYLEDDPKKTMDSELLDQLLNICDTV